MATIKKNLAPIQNSFVQRTCQRGSPTPKVADARCSMMREVKMISAEMSKNFTVYETVLP